MINFKRDSGQRSLRKISATFLTFLFSFTLIFPPHIVSAQNISGFNLPLPGTLITQTSTVIPPLIKGIEFHPENPFQLNFIIDTGEKTFNEQELKDESLRMIKYFMASLTVPEDEMWVNLSPYEQDRIIPDAFGQTSMGIDLLAEDYLLKQLTSSLMYPEQELGKEFWNKIHERAYQEYGVKNIPMDSFHKVWIVAKDAEVVQMGNRAFVMNSSLEVLTEQDYLASREVHGSSLMAHSGQEPSAKSQELSQLQTEIMREIVIPAIENEVNEGAHFAKLRQIYDAMILATWFKITLKESILGKIYVDQNKTAGVNIDTPEWKQKIYHQYLEAFRKGAYDYIKEEPDAATGRLIPRRYFSGGASPNQTADGAMLSTQVRKGLKVFDPATASQELYGRLKSAMIPNSRTSKIVLVAANFRHSEYDPSLGQAEETNDEAMLATASIIPPEAEEGLLASIHERYPAMPGTADPELLMLLNKVANNKRGFLFHDISLEAIIPELGPIAQVALGKGGLGFLTGETWGATTAGIGFLPLYENTQDGIHIDWDNEKNVHKLLDAQGNHVSLDVELAKKPYKVQVYWVNRNGRIIFGLRNAEIFNRLYPDPETGEDRLRQYGFLGKAYVALVQHLNMAPDLVRLNEAQLLFIKKAMEGDIRNKREDSLFHNSKMVMINHTPEQTALPKLFGEKDKYRQWLTGILGADLVTNELFRDSSGRATYFNGKPAILMAERLAQKADTILTVSEEHGEITKRHVLPEFAWKTTYVQNGSDPWQWYTDFLKGKVAEIGGPEQIEYEGIIPGAEIFNNKQEVQKPLLNAWLADHNKNQFDDLDRPLFGAIRRILDYKEQGILFAMLDWITGDPNKEYNVPISGWPDERRKGLGANILIGGPDSGKKEWFKKFEDLAKDKRYKGKLVFVGETGTEIMKLAVSASDFWLVTARETREASGTGDQRAEEDGTPVIASATGGPLELYDFEKKETPPGIRLVSAFNVLQNGFDKRWEEVVEILDTPGHPAHEAMKEQYRIQAQLQFGQYMQEFVDMYNDYKEKGLDGETKGQLLKEIEGAFYWGHKKFSIARMANDLEDVFEAVLNGTGAAGYESKQIPATDNKDAINTVMDVLSRYYHIQDGQDSLVRRFLEGRGSLVDAMNAISQDYVRRIQEEEEGGAEKKGKLSYDSVKQIVLSAWVIAANLGQVDSLVEWVDDILRPDNIMGSGWFETIFLKQLGELGSVGKAQYDILKGVFFEENELRTIDASILNGEQIAPDKQHIKRKKLAQRWQELKALTEAVQRDGEEEVAGDEVLAYTFEWLKYGDLEGWNVTSTRIHTAVKTIDLIITVPGETPYEMKMDAAQFRRDMIRINTFVINREIDKAKELIKALRDKGQPSSAVVNTEEDVAADEAMLTSESGAIEKPETTGGIDLNTGFLDLKIRRDDSGIPLPVYQQPIQEMMEIPGLTPVIINVTPIQSLPMMLGLEGEPDEEEISIAQADLVAKLD